MTFLHSNSNSPSLLPPTQQTSAIRPQNTHGAAAASGGRFAPVCLAAQKTAMMAVLWFWARVAGRTFYAAEHKHNPYAAPMFKLAMSIIGALVGRLDLSPAEKSALLRKLFRTVQSAHMAQQPVLNPTLQQAMHQQLSLAKHHARLDKIYAAYVIWRQRMCWKWGGGFSAPAPGYVPDVSGGVASGARDHLSYDALIPN